MYNYTGYGMNPYQQAINNVAVAGMQNTNALASQLADCCCTTQRSIDSVRYENAKNTCDIVNAIKADCDATRALMTQNEIQSLRDQLQHIRHAVHMKAHRCFHIMEQLVIMDVGAKAFI